MMNVPGPAIEQMLQKDGIGFLRPITFVAHRIGCSVWRSELRTIFGDADIDILAYPIGQDPGCIVNLEEEKTALTERGSATVLLREIRDETVAVLVSCAAAQSGVFDRMLNRTASRSGLYYHPQLDRITGGDVVRPWSGHWLKSSVASIDKAMYLKDLLLAAGESYRASPQWPGKLERPLPQLVAILSLETEEPIEGAPAEYANLAVMQLLIGGNVVIKDAPPSAAAQLQQFVRQFFGFLASQHRVGLCYSRGAGSCIRSALLEPNGALTDIYFLNRAQKDTAGELCETDLRYGLYVVCELCAVDSPLLSELIETAICQYTGRIRLPPDEHAAAVGAARYAQQSGLESLDPIAQLMYLNRSAGIK